MQAQRARLPDGRWHLQHGPIDLVIGAEGEPDAVEELGVEEGLDRGDGDVLAVGGLIGVVPGRPAVEHVGGVAR